MSMEQLQDDLADALQSDLENGVKWLNEMAAKEFYTNYPALGKVIAAILCNEYTNS
jgi:hypothetical protein